MINTSLAYQAGVTAAASYFVEAVGELSHVMQNTPRGPVVVSDLLEPADADIRKDEMALDAKVVAIVMSVTEQHAKEVNAKDVLSWFR